MHLLKVLAVFAVPLILVIYLAVFPDWDSDEYNMTVFFGHAASLIIGFVTILAGMQLLTRFPRDDSVQEKVRTAPEPIPDNLPQLRAQTASGQAWVRWWLHLLKTIAVFAVPSFALFKLAIFGNENPDTYPALVGIGSLIALVAFFGGGIYGLFLLDNFPHDWATDDPEDDEDDD